MENLSVIGCGTMGRSIALNAALYGVSVTLKAFDERERTTAVEYFKEQLLLLQQYDMPGVNHTAEIIKLITITCNEDEAIEQATFIIEAIPEVLSLKQELFKKLANCCAPNVIIASNTSSLNLAEMTAGINDQGRFIVTHFWNPAHLIPLVEVLRGDSTSIDTFDRTCALLNVLHKKMIEIKRPIPGFVGNRLQFALFREAQHLLEEGVASAEDIDSAVTYGIGRRLPVTGPFLSADLGGLDVFLNICKSLYPNLSNISEPNTVLKALVDHGDYGLKSGKGFYNWGKSFAANINQQRENELINYLKKDALKDSNLLATDFRIKTS